MQEILKVLIVNASAPFAFVALGFFGAIAVCVSGFLIRRSMRESTRLEHEESMAKIETTHREVMLKIQREQPKLVDGSGGRAKVIDDQRE